VSHSARFCLVFQNLVAICFFSFLVNEIGDAGVSYIAEALKMNNTLNKIDFYCD